MSENIQDPKTEEEEQEDNRTFEEKFKSFIQKVKPYFDQVMGCNRKKLALE